MSYIWLLEDKYSLGFSNYSVYLFCLSGNFGLKREEYFQIVLCVCYYVKTQVIMYLKVSVFKLKDLSLMLECLAWAEHMAQRLRALTALV